MESNIIGSSEDEVGDIDYAELIGIAENELAESVHETQGTSRQPHSTPGLECTAGISEVEYFMNALTDTNELELCDFRDITFMLLRVKTMSRGASFIGSSQSTKSDGGPVLVLRDVQLRIVNFGNQNSKDKKRRNMQNPIVYEFEESTHRMDLVRFMVVYLGLRGVFSVEFREAVETDNFQINSDVLDNPLFPGVYGKTRRIVEGNQLPATLESSLFLRLSKKLSFPKSYLVSASFRKGGLLDYLKVFMQQQPDISISQLMQKARSFGEWKQERVVEPYTIAANISLERLWTRWIDSRELSDRSDNIDDYFLGLTDLIQFNNYGTQQILSDGAALPPMPSEEILQKAFEKERKKSERARAEKVAALELEIDTYSQLDSTNMSSFTRTVYDAKVSELKHFKETSSKEAKSYDIFRDNVLRRRYERILTSSLEKFRLIGPQPQLKSLDVSAIARDPRNTFVHTESLFKKWSYEPNNDSRRPTINWPDGLRCPIGDCNLYHASETEIETCYKSRKPTAPKTTIRCHPCNKEVGYASFQKHIKNTHSFNIACTKCGRHLNYNDSLIRKNVNNVRTIIRGCKECETDEYCADRGVIKLHWSPIEREFCGCELGNCVMNTEAIKKILVLETLRISAATNYPIEFTNNEKFVCQHDGQDDFKKFSSYKVSYLNDCDVDLRRITQIELPKKLVVTRLVDNNLYGFWKEDWDKLDYSKLIQVCLDTKEVTTLKVSDWSTNQQYNPNTYEGIWIGRTFVKNFDSYDRTLDHFFAFSLDSLQWRKLDIAFKCRGGRHPLSNNENTLVVKTHKHKRKNDRGTSSLLSSPKDLDRFAFDKDGRFIYVWRNVNKWIGSLLVYDIIFNDYVELSPDPSFSKLKRPDYDGVWFMNCLPVSAEQLLTAYKIDEIHNIVLIGIDFQQRTFGVLDISPPVFNCYIQTLVRDGDVFGLFYLRTIFNTEEPRESRNFYAFIKFTIQADRIKMDEKIIRFGYQIESYPTSLANRPLVLHLYQNKLWFVRRVKVRFGPISPPRAPFDDEYNFSYFDLSEENPTEKLVRILDLSHLVEPNISQFNWVKDTMIVQLTNTQLELCNLTSFEWSTMDTNLDLCWTEDKGKQMEENWANYRRFVNRDYFMSEVSPIHVDNHFARMSVNRKSGHLHRVPLREPFKLKDLAWTVVLNAGVLSSNQKLPKKLPYSRVF